MKTKLSQRSHHRNLLVMHYNTSFLTLALRLVGKAAQWIATEQKEI